MIELTYTLSKPDFLEAQRVWCSKEIKKLPGYTVLMAAAVVMGCMIGLTFHYLPVWLIVSLWLSLTAYWAAAQWRKKAVWAQQYTKNIEDMKDLWIRLDDDGFSSEQTATCRAWIAWSRWSGWRETPRIFILGRGLTFVTIPKSAMSQEQQTGIRTLLETKIGPAL